MSLEAVVPRERDERTTKDIIIHILSKDWPLSARKIYSHVKKNKKGKDISYQAVHKTLKSLVGIGVLERTGRDYRISEEWMNETEKFISVLKDKYSKGENGLGFDGDSQFVFNTIYEVDKFLAEFAGNLLRKGGKEKPTMCLQWKHFWIPLFLDKKVYSRLKDFINQVEFYFAVTSNTPVDKWCHEFWSKNNVNSAYGVGDSGISDHVVLGDFIMQIFYPKEIMKEMDEIFSSAKKIHDIKPQKLFEHIFERKTTIPVTITKNPVLADQLRKRILSYFKKKGAH